jgi:hypothetical protein
MEDSGLAIAIIVAAAVVGAAIAAIAAFRALSRGRRFRLDTEKGRRSFLGSDFLDVTLKRVRSSQVYKNQYFSVSEFEVPLDSTDRAPAATQETRDFLRVVAEKPDGKASVVHSEEYGPEALARLSSIVAEWKAFHRVG